ncbi:MAG: baseplate protein, partial [Actinobacteria bacterium]|nr:baseplate protein [Actinomycetota bacterium]
MPLPVLDVPTYETKLISTNKTIKYRPFLVKEHKVLLMLKDANSSEISRVVTDIIDNCTFHKLKMQDLAFFDIVHLCVELRKVSIGENLDL